MNSDDTKLFLHACRFGDADPDDPRLAEALEQTRRDPALLAWFNHQQALDQTIVEQLQQVRVPPDLAQRIIVGRKARQRERRRQYLLPLAAAAVLTILMALGMLVSKPSQTPATEFAALRADMASFLVTFPRLDLETDQWPAMIRWLDRNPALARVDIPPGLQRFPGLGCREVEWRGKKVMLVCFAAQGQVVHLFIMPRTELRGTPAASQPELNRVEGWSTASWTQGETVYLALTQGEQAFLQRILSSNAG